jgi:hypothetical protein
LSQFPRFEILNNIEHQEERTLQMNEIIKTMIAQFCVNPNRLVAMIGANSFVYNNETNLISFKFKMCKVANVCRLSYMSGVDLYKMEFLKIRGIDIKEVKTFEEIYAEDLKRFFEEFTGLRISL